MCVCWLHVKFIAGQTGQTGIDLYTKFPILLYRLNKAADDTSADF